MKINFEFDATALTIREADTILDDIVDKIQIIIEDNGFKSRLIADKASIKWIVEDV